MRYTNNHPVRLKGSLMVHTYYGDPNTHKLFNSRKKAEQYIKNYNNSK